jgi:hypothetical protein
MSTAFVVYGVLALVVYGVLALVVSAAWIVAGHRAKSRRRGGRR